MPDGKPAPIASFQPAPIGLSVLVWGWGQGAARADDRRLQCRPADAGAAGVLGRRLQQGAGGDVRRRRRSCQSGERVGIEHGGRT